MNFKLNNFYIGLIDLFAILLPGAMLGLLLYVWIGASAFEGILSSKAMLCAKEYQFNFSQMLKH